MATNDFLATNVVFQYRTAGSTDPYKTLVCETSLNGVLSSNVNTLSTKCGQIKSLGVVGATISGSGAANTAPTSTQGSLAALLDFAAAQTLLEGRMINLATTSPSVGLGAAVLIKGNGYFTNVSPKADADQSLTFDWTFEITGTVDTTEANES
jgi:hypothetical protein